MGFSTAGQRQFQNQVFVDGATNAQQFYGTQAESYPQDWVQEFQVMTNGFSAEFGQASGGVLNVITRSGSNTFAGRLYGFYRNDNLDTPPFAGQFKKDSGGKYDINQPIFLAAVPAFNQYRAGGFLGGPVLKNKAFFFGGVRDVQQQPGRGSRHLAVLARPGRDGGHPREQHQQGVHGRRAT